MKVKLSIISIFFLAVTTFSSILKCNNLEIKKARSKYEKLEVYYLPWNAKLEIGCTEDELKNNKDNIASYYCTREKETILKILSIVRECTVLSRSADNFAIDYPMMILQFRTADNIVEEFICDERFFISNNDQVFVIMQDTRLKLSKYIPKAEGVYNDSIITNDCNAFQR